MGNFFKRLFRFGSTKGEPKSAPVEEKSIEFDKIDINALMGNAPDDVIDRFLQCSDLRITADNTTKYDADVQTEPNLTAEEDVVSEELAKIYLSQGLNREAIEIYRKLSLLNSEKSTYFAKLIAIIENK